jgi:aspartyl-tRNA(Asn)/glutamyl-tRNA(Gln) amidotransferase subunit C|tara:strand:- start:913 stop:1197 length:285 start_codon:yes stop_codon:yes gene_type:complete
MKVDKELIEHVADIARLKLTDKEVKEFQLQLKEILNTFSEIDKVNTDNTKPSFQPVEVKNIMREDKIGSCLTQEEALSSTEHKKDGYFKGPKVV